MPGEEGGGIVWVPRSPGSLLRPAPRARDDLDELIDELLPDTTEGPGPADAALVAAGGALLGWTVVGNPPAVATTAGAVALGLGCILPGRALWRRLVGRRRARHGSALASRASPLRADDALVARLVAGYEEVDAGPGTPASARAAAHGAVLEVASLLDGRAPASARERSYVEARAVAIEELAAALRALGDAGGPDPSTEPYDLVVEAREELDALGVNALTRLDDVTEEVQDRARRR